MKGLQKELEVEEREHGFTEELVLELKEVQVVDSSGEGGAAGCKAC